MNCREQLTGPALSLLQHNLSDRVKYKAGNALTDDLGEQQYDLVMINNVVHHFTNEENFALAKKVARALKPGGIYAIGEFIRFEKPGEGGVVGATAGLYFSLTSSSGTWSEKEIRSWQTEAGLKLARSNKPGNAAGMENADSI